MNVLDKLISAFSPQAGLRRAQARQALQLYGDQKRTFEGASKAARLSGLAGRIDDAPSAVRPYAKQLRGNIRELRRNSVWANKSINVICDQTVGYGFSAKSQLPELDAAWRSWSESTACDYLGVSTFGGLTRQVMGAVGEAGEALAVRRISKKTRRLKIQLLEADYLDSDKGEDGIERDSDGDIVAYWLFDRHPGDALKRGAPKSSKVPASEVIHVFLPERPGQTRGVSRLAPSVVRMWDYETFEDAELTRRKVASCFAGFIKDNRELFEEKPTEISTINLQPGIMQPLKPGTDVVLTQPPNVSETGEYAKACLRAIAAGNGITYADLTGDYTNATFSSGRMERIAAWRRVEVDQWLMLIPLFCDRVWAWHAENFAATEEGISAAAKLIALKTKADWVVPAMPIIDPSTDTESDTKAVRSGLKTLSEAIRERGKDPEAHFAEMQEDCAKIDSLGLVLDSDPRKLSQQGQNQQTYGKTQANPA